MSPIDELTDIQSLAMYPLSVRALRHIPTEVC